MSIIFTLASVLAWVLIGAYIAGIVVPPFFRLWIKIIATLLWPIVLSGALIVAAYTRASDHSW